MNKAKLLTSSLGAICLVALALPATARPAEPAKGATLPQRADGFVPFFFDSAKGRVLIEIPAFDEDVLYYVSAATGGGSVELPFDRGVVDSAVIRFQRAGGKVLVTERNLRFRSLSGDAAHAAGVEDSFPTSTLAALPIESDSGGRVVVDATSFFMRDAANVEAQLRRTNQGSFKFDAGKSVFYPQRMKAFPDNTEIETVATFTADNPGALVSGVTPDPRLLTMRIHHSFLRAPTG